MNAEESLTAPKVREITIAPKDFNITQSRQKLKAIEKEQADYKRQQQKQQIKSIRDIQKYYDDLGHTQRYNQRAENNLKYGLQKNLPPKITLYDALQIGYTKDPEKQQELLSRKPSARGYIVDKDLTNENHMTAYDPNSDTLLYVVNGTNLFKAQDYLTDANLAIGMLPQTSRFKDDQRAYFKAKRLYDPKHIRIAGHSLGGAIASKLEQPSENIEIHKPQDVFNGLTPTGNPSPRDKDLRPVKLNKRIDINKKGLTDPYDISITSFNSASSIFDKLGSYKNPIEKSYRHHHDLVSSFKKNTITITKDDHPSHYTPTLFHPIKDQYNSHALENIKKSDFWKTIFV